MKASAPILTTLIPPIVDGMVTAFGPFVAYPVIVPLLLSKVKYDSSVGFNGHQGGGGGGTTQASIPNTLISPGVYGPTIETLSQPNSCTLPIGSSAIQSLL
jgi:hypothetical protein